MRGSGSRDIARRLVAIATLICLSATVGPSGGAAEDGNARDAANELKSFEDPTILTRRVWLDTEWNKFSDESAKVEQTIGGLWAWQVGSDQDWAVRIKAPATFYFAGDNPGDTDREALGDIKVATGTAVRLRKTLRAGGGIELRMPSGTDETLSENVWQLQEFGAVAWDATQWLTFSPSFEHNHSIDEQSGAGRNHFLELFFPATLLLAEHWALTARYEAKIDFKNAESVTQSAKVQIAKQLEDAPVGFALSLKKPFEGNTEKDFQINFVTTYYFRSD